jgi:double-stranded uracil-DNA glycosylase
VVPAVPPDGAGRQRRRATAGLKRPSATRATARVAGPDRPSPRDLAAAVDRRATVPDIVAPGLDVLFVGINPGRWSGAVGHHFAHPGNRFWKALHLAGFTDRQLDPSEERLLLGFGIGITNLVNRTTATADALDPEELRGGSASLERKVRRLRPRTVAVLGMGAFRVAFHRPHAAAGRQPERLGGAVVWVLPNPSGLQAAYGLDRMVDELRALRDFVHSSF